MQLFAFFFKNDILAPMVERLKRWMSFLSYEDQDLLAQSAPNGLDLANILVENAVGYFHLPFCIAPSLSINQRHYPLIPLVTEETSVIAALTKQIVKIQAYGTLTASQSNPIGIGQIHFPHLSNPEQFIKTLNAHQDHLIRHAHEGPCSSMVARGGGIREIQVRTIQRPMNQSLGIIHLMINTQEAMGANVITQTCEYLRPLAESICSEKALMGIVTNHTPESLIQVDLILEKVNPEIAERICAASDIAQWDHYRAATHNKGILNGMDSVCLATGNDWRALETGLHAFAAQDGYYKALSQWKTEGSKLHGILRGPINVGVIGGMTTLHPLSALALRCLKNPNRQELAFLIGAVGLIQNLGALSALVTEGITSGHMRLHARNLLQQLNAKPEEQEKALKRLEDLLRTQKFLTTQDAKKTLKDLRS